MSDLSPLQKFLLESMLNDNAFVFVISKDNKENYKAIPRDVTRRLAYNIFEENGYDVLHVFDLEEDVQEQLAVFGRP